METNSKNYKAIVTIPGWANRFANGELSDPVNIRNTADAYSYIPLIYRAIMLRCDALTSTPIHVFKGESENKWPFLCDLTDIIWLTEAASMLKGAAYWEKIATKGGKVLDVQWVNPFSMKVEIGKDDKGKQTLLFKQNANGDAVEWKQEQMVYFHEFNPLSDIQPGIAAAEAALQDSKLLGFLTSFPSAFFEGGAMPAVLLGIDGLTTTEEKERVQGFFRQRMTGLRNAFRILAVGTKDITPTTLTPPLKDLAMPDLNKQAVHNVALAFGIPVTMLEDAANFACLPADQHVFTPQGPKEIASLKTGDEIWQYSENGIVKNTVNDIIPQGKAPVYKIRTPHRIIKASENHPILTVNVTPGVGPYNLQKSELVWKRADEIERGDLIISVEELPHGNRTSVDNIVITEKLAELLGLYLGDGDGSERTGVRFAIPQGELQEYYARSSEEIFTYSSTNGRLYNNKKLKCRRGKYIFIVGSADTYRLFNKLGVTGKSKTKRVPSWVYECSLEIKLAFLRGYLDSDGTVGKDGRIVFGCANKSLIHDIRALCISCGIPVSNVLSDVGRCGNFGPIELHRFICGYPKYNRLIGTHDNKYFDRINIISMGKDGRYQQGSHCVWNISLPSGVGIEKVKSVEYIGEEKVFDLCTSGSHTFIAEGLVVHNTAKEHRLSFWQDTIRPRGNKLASVINRQLLAPMGLELKFGFDELDIFQEDEERRSASYLNYINAKMKPSIAAQILGIDLPEGIEYSALDEKPAVVEPVVDEPIDGSPRKSITAELKRWERFVLKRVREGKKPQREFVSKELPASLMGAIGGQLENSVDEKAVRAIFRDAERWQGYP